METPDGRFYGYPDHAGEGFKIGKYHHLGQQLEDPDELDRECHPEDESVLRAGYRYLLSFGQWADSQDGYLYVHQYAPLEISSSTDLTTKATFFVAAGFSGHGFKFCSVIGKVMADFCQDRSPAWDIDRFRLR